MRLLRLSGLIFSLSLRRELTFRANFLFQVMMTLIGGASIWIALTLIYTRTGSLAGWNQGEAAILLGTFQLVSGFLATFVEPNLSWFGGQIKDGRFDHILLRPVSSLFSASLGSCAPLAITQLLPGLAIICVGLRQLNAAPSFWNWLGWLLLLAVGCGITWASRVLLASLAFWTPAIELDVLYSAVWQFGRYPSDIYHQPLRAILTYVLPIAFVATFPALALTRGPALPILLPGAALGLLAILLTHLVWQRGLRRYTSATS
ncbi:ABC transporter permease [Dictyobacter aurantiacus]|uniref:ABC transporter permease n=1 Tax=Dictyobacter aurantiacus TaxID=1936993 RepID=A0A401ZJS5_9CHLR|nr:ABC-2 family transporter protein [Dictyobacter aurantiacus]GCE07078.1 ABC transporter permease [Dictyobacter aurantiacus]